MTAGSAPAAATAEDQASPRILKREEKFGQIPVFSQKAAHLAVGSGATSSVPSVAGHRAGGRHSQPDLSDRPQLIKRRHYGCD